MKTSSIWLIDDDMICRFTTQKILESGKMQISKIISFENAFLAFELMQENVKNIDVLPDIIFLDIDMPFMNGWQFIEAFGKIKTILAKEIKIYMVSSSTCFDDIQKAREIEDINGYFIKPLSMHNCPCISKLEAIA